PPPRAVPSTTLFRSLGVIDDEGDIAAVGADAAGDGDAAGVRTRAVGRLVADADGQAFVVLAQDDVDHAADRVSAVDRAGAFAQDLDALDGGGRDQVDVGGGAVGGGRLGHAAAVQQHQ